MAKKEPKVAEKEYRTLQFRIKKGDELFDYCDDLCFKSKNIYNVGMFHLRQLMTGLKKDKALIQTLEAEVIQKVESSLSELNDIKEREHEKKNQKRLENGKEVFKASQNEINVSFGQSETTRRRSFKTSSHGAFQSFLLLRTRLRSSKGRSQDNERNR